MSSPEQNQTDKSSANPPLVQIRYSHEPRETDEHADRYRYDFAPEGTEESCAGVDLGVMGGVNYPNRVGINFVAFVCPISSSNVEISGHIRRGTTSEEQLGAIALSLANAVQQITAAFELPTTPQE